MFPRISRLVLPPIILICALLIYRIAFSLAGGAPSTKIAPPHPEPLKIEARYTEPRIATDAQLFAVLDRVKPPADKIETNNMVHALRMWGAAADFGDAKIPTGKQMRDYILDDKAFQQMAGKVTPPLITRTPTGLQVRSYDDGPDARVTSSYHTDDLLATLGETRTPLATPIFLRDGTSATVQELLVDSLGSFHLDRHEYEWSVICYARFLYPQKKWLNKYGEKIDMAELVDELINHPLELGPCNGLHRLEAMVVLYRADEQLHQLPNKTRQKMLAHMHGVSQLLVAAQHEDGYWSRAWPRGKKAFDMAATPATQGKAEAGKTAAKPVEISLHDKLLVTGHQLEWLALAPEEVQPPRETIVRAGQWLAKTLVEMDQKELTATYGPYSHAARALCLWRGVEPFDAWKAGAATEQTQVQN